MKLSVNDISLRYNNTFQALDSISFEAHTGMLGLLGPNGAGKSTLMRILATLQQPQSGSIFFEGINILKEGHKLRNLLGYLPQEFGVYPNISAVKLLDYFALLKGLHSTAHRKEKIEEVLNITNLTADKFRAVSTFSGGMKQRFGIAQLLLNDPKLIIVDEPTSGLDPGERKRFLNLLRELSTECIVIFSTHIVEDLENLCKYLVILNKGKTCLSGNTKELLSAYKNKIFTEKVQSLNAELLRPPQKILSFKQNYDDTFSIRYYTEGTPPENSKIEDPGIEDIYFLTVPELEKEAQFKGYTNSIARAEL